MGFAEKTKRPGDRRVGGGHPAYPDDYRPQGDQRGKQATRQMQLELRDDPWSARDIGDNARQHSDQRYQRKRRGEGKAGTGVLKSSWTKRRAMPAMKRNRGKARRESMSA